MAFTPASPTVIAVFTIVFNPGSLRIRLPCPLSYPYTGTLLQPLMATDTLGAHAWCLVECSQFWFVGWLTASGVS